MMVEVELAVAAIDADHLLPVAELERTVVVLDQFEFVGEAASNHQLVLAARVVRTDFFRDQPLVVLVQGDTFHKTVNLLALGEDLDLALSVVGSLLTIGAHIVELVFVDEELW